MPGLVEGKIAIIYGGGGGIGGGEARTLAREGARVFLSGRTPEPLEAVATARPPPDSHPIWLRKTQPFDHRKGAP